MANRWYRSRRDRIIGGVCGGIAENLRIDPTIVRLAWVLLTFVTHGALALVYFVLLFLLPEAPEGPVQPLSAPGEAEAAASSQPDPARSAAPQSPPDGRTGALAAGAALLVLGGYFLVRQYLPSFDVAVSWPVVAVGLGVVLIIAALRPGGRSG